MDSNSEAVRNGVSLSNKKFVSAHHIVVTTSNCRETSEVQSSFWDEALSVVLPSVR